VREVVFDDAVHVKFKRASRDGGNRGPEEINAD
jgi:hypothetical protein